MASEQNLTIEHKPTLRLSMQQLRFVKLLEYNTPELEDAIDKELEENPALEISEDTERESEPLPRYFMAQGRDHDDAINMEALTPDTGESLIDVLVREISERKIPDAVRITARYIIGNLDSNGYLRRPLEAIINDMAFGPGIDVSQEDAQKAFELVRDLEPYGVGAIDLRDCLRLQLIHLPETQQRNDALEIVDNQFEAFTMKHSHKIVSALKLSKERVKEAINLILTLNPKPGASFNNEGDNANIIIPDLTVTVEEGEISIATNNRIPVLAIDRSFTEAVESMERNSAGRKKKGTEFITSRYNDARDFIKILRQRQETLVGVMTAIVKIQKDYFLTQDIYQLKPMMIKDISALTGYDLSVVSRATNNKYVATHWGVFPLRFFFSDSIGDEGESSTEILTNRKIEAEIAALVAKEDKKHPLSDEKLRIEMEKRGYDVSRRTVAKYRDRKGIPVARLRKEM